MAPKKNGKTYPASKQTLHHPSAEKTNASSLKHAATTTTTRVLRSGTRRQRLSVTLDSSLEEDNHEENDSDDLSVTVPTLEANNIELSGGMSNQRARRSLPVRKPKLHSRMKDKQEHVPSRVAESAKAVVQEPPRTNAEMPISKSPDPRDSIKRSEHPRNWDVAPSVRFFQPSGKILPNLYHDQPQKRAAADELPSSSVLSDPLQGQAGNPELSTPSIAADLPQGQSRDSELPSSPLSAVDNSSEKDVPYSSAVEGSAEEQSEDDELPSSPVLPENDEEELFSAVELTAPPPEPNLSPASRKRKELLSPTSLEWETAKLKEAKENRDKAYKKAAVSKAEWMEENTHRIWTGHMKHDFMGWVELEADPDYFTIMLKRLGIEKAKVVEVHSLDEMLTDHHCLKYGIMFLSRYHDEELPVPDEPAPKRLWFTNQTVDNACATVGILNIINNVKSLDIGENLKSFKNFTQEFNPVMKGEALMNFTWCRSIHNAFAKRTEMLAANMVLEQAATTSRSRFYQRKRSSEDDGIAVANHYIVYVPFEGSLWKLDGLDMHPRNLGPLHGGESWLEDVKFDVQKRMSVFADDSTAGFTILGIVEDKIPSLIESLGRSVNYLNWTEYCLDGKRRYWKKSTATHPEDNEWPSGGEPIRGPDYRYGLTQEFLDRDGVCMTKAQKLDLSSCSEEYLTLERPLMVKEQLHLRALIPALLEESQKQWAKYKDRMFDYGPVIHQWLSFLKENGNLDALISWHAREGAGLNNVPEEFQAAVESQAEAPDWMHYSDASDKEADGSPIATEPEEEPSDRLDMNGEVDATDLVGFEEVGAVEGDGDEDVEAGQAYEEVEGGGEDADGNNRQDDDVAMEE